MRQVIGLAVILVGVCAAGSACAQPALGPALGPPASQQSAASGQQSAATGRRQPAESGVFEPFEGPDVSWRQAGGDARYRIVQHKRISGADAHSGNGCEFLQIQGEGGTAIYIAHDIARPMVIDDLRISVWLKADRPGAQLLARVVLPRTIDPRSGQPLVTYLTGGSYSNVGRWQRLNLDNVPQALARQVRLLRSQVGPNVDARQAFVDLALLNVYGGPGVTHVWIDDLDVTGLASAPAGAGGQSPAGPLASGAWESGDRTPDEGPALTLPPGAAVAPGNGVPALPIGMRGSARTAAGGGPPLGPGAATAAGLTPTAPADRPMSPAARPAQRRVALSGSVLLVDGRPMFPRAIQYRGEPLSLLKRLGFNTVWVESLPPTALLDEAAQLGLGVVCPPPRPTRLDMPAEKAPTMAEFGPEFGSVLAWNLGHGLGAAQYDTTRRWAELIRLADRAGGRPLVCRPASDLRGYSRHCDLLLIDRRPLGTSLELTDYGQWVRQQPRLARPGTPIWTTLQTQLAPAVLEQLAAIDSARRPPTSVSYEQLRLLLYVAVSSGSRGVLMLSDSPLSLDDPDTQNRARAIELLNLELDLMEPWTAAGSFVALADTQEKQVLGAVMRNDRARLLMPAWVAPGAQFTLPQSGARHLPLTVPGVPESTGAYELVPGGLQNLQHKRVTGGIRVTLDEFDVGGLALMAQEPIIINSLEQRTKAIGPRSIELKRQIAAARLDAVQAIMAQLGQHAPPPAQSTPVLLTGQQSLKACETQIAGKQYAAAYREAGRTLRAVRTVERAHWDYAAAALIAPLSSPGMVAFGTLPWHTALMRRVGNAQPGPNLLAGGEMEDLSQVLGAGWRYVQQPLAGVTAAAEIVPQAARTGRGGLLLRCKTDEPDKGQRVLESAPAWIQSPPIHVEAGQLLCVHGWVNVQQPLTGSVDGLLIFDSLGGEALAHRFTKTNGWQRFFAYRIAPRSGPLTLTIAMTGLGEALLDDVAVQVVTAR